MLPRTRFPIPALISSVALDSRLQRYRLSPQFSTALVTRFLASLTKNTYRPSPDSTGLPEVPSGAVLAARGITDVGLLATRGTYDAALYQRELDIQGVRCHLPLQAERDEVMRGIYDGVKAGNLPLARRCFSEVAQALVTARL